MKEEVNNRIEEEEVEVIEVEEEEVSQEEEVEEEDEEVELVLEHIDFSSALHRPHIDPLSRLTNSLIKTIFKHPTYQL